MSSKDDLRTVLSKSFRAPHFFCFFIRRHILLKIEPITMKLVQVIGQKMDIADWEYMYTPYYICTNSKTNQAQIN